MSNLVFPGACMGSFTAAAPGGDYADDFAGVGIGNTQDLAGRVATWSGDPGEGQGGWTWIHQGATPGALIVHGDVDGVRSIGGQTWETYYVDIGATNQFVEVQYEALMDAWVRDGGMMVKQVDDDNFCWLDTRFNYQMRFYTVTGGVQTSQGDLMNGTVPVGATLRIEINGYVATLYVNDVEDGSTDLVSEPYTGFNASTRAGLSTGTRSSSTRSLLSFRAGSL